MKKILFFLFIFIVILINCKNNKKTISTNNNVPVSIIDNENYYTITIDYTTGISPREAGRQLGEKILQKIPDYESIVDKILYDMVKDICIFKGGIDATDDAFNDVINLVYKIRPNINKEYYEEAEGIVSNFHYYESNNLKDGKLSRDEFYFYNLITDIGGVIFGKLIGKVDSPIACSAISVFNEKSSTSKPIIARLLDCLSHELSKLHAITIIRNNDRSICLIGVAGSNSVLSILNDNKIFSAILFSHTGEKCDYEDPLIPIGYDLRYALEEYSTLNKVSNYIRNNKEYYITNSNVFISDSKESMVMENNLTKHPKSSELRMYDSKLIDEVNWDFEYSIATVNSFLLYNHEDNHTQNSMNYLRWNNIVTGLNKASEQESEKGEKITVNEVKTIASFHQKQRPSSMSKGDIYNNATRQIIIFQPHTMSLEVFFTPFTRKLPEKPLFNKIDINFSD